MNTPRTKPPARYSPKVKDAPDGMYSAGISNMGLAAVVGNIITLWPHTEEHVANLFGDLVGIEDEASARLVFQNHHKPNCTAQHHADDARKIATAQN
jgi:hypothetical protein